MRIAGRENQRKEVVYRRASAPWVICVRFEESKGGGGVWRGSEVGGVGGGTIGGARGGSAIMCVAEGRWLWSLCALVLL